MLLDQTGIKIIWGQPDDFNFNKYSRHCRDFFQQIILNFMTASPSWTRWCNSSFICCFPVFRVCPCGSVSTHLQCLKPANRLNVSFSPLIRSWDTAVITPPRLLGLSAGLDAPAGTRLRFITERRDERSAGRFDELPVNTGCSLLACPHVWYLIHVNNCWKRDSFSPREVKPWLSRTRGHLLDHEILVLLSLAHDVFVMSWQ